MHSNGTITSGLAKFRFDVNLLMILAAAGAAGIGYIFEAAVLMFLFSLSNTLEVYTMGRTRRALDEMVVEGIETTLPLFRALVREPAIIDGDYHIHWLEQYLAGQAAGTKTP